MTPQDRLATLLPFEDRVLARYAPGTTRRRIGWRGGSTEVLELGDGPPLVLVHGGLGDAFHWAPIFPALARRHRVIAVHRPGHGLADPFDYRGVDVLPHAVAFLEDVFGALGTDSADVVANSTGGWWAAALAIAHPARVRSLLLVGAPAGTKRQVPWLLRAVTWPVVGPLVQALMRRPTRESTRDFWRRLCVAHPERLDDAMLDATAASQRTNVETWIAFVHRFLDRGGFRPDLLLDWPQVSVPVRFIWGEHDAFGAPDEARVLCGRMPAADHVVVRDAGHLPWLDDPDAVVEAIESFLARPMGAGRFDAA